MTSAQLVFKIERGSMATMSPSRALANPNMTATGSRERWSSLVLQIADDEAALEKLYEETKNIIFGFAMRILRTAPPPKKSLWMFI